MKKKVIILLSILCLVSVLIGINRINYETNNRLDNLKEVSIALDKLIPYGYEISLNNYMNVIGDANLSYNNLNTYVHSIKIVLDEAVEKDVDIQIYYANSKHDYNEETSKSGVISKGNNEGYIVIDDNVENIRFDITSNKGDSFKLESIVLNDSDSIILDKNVRAFSNWVKGISILLIVCGIIGIFIIKLSVEKSYIILAFITGIIYMFIITPFSPPDEAHHYQTAYKLSNIMMLKWNNVEYGNEEDFNYYDFVTHQNVKTAYGRLLEQGFGKADNASEQVIIPKPNNLYYYMMYLPQALGMTIARIFHGNFIWIFYLGRLMNLIFFISCMYIAIKRIPIMKTCLFVIGMFPMVLQQAASMSYDSFINGLSILLIAYLLAAIYEKGELAREDYIWIAVSSILLAPAKIVYSVIIGLALLIPKERFKSNKDYWLKIAFIIGIMFLVFGIVNLSQVHNVLNKTNVVNWDGGQTYSIGFILQHPLQTINIFISSIKRFGIEWMKESVGFRLSGLTLEINSVLISLFIGMLILASLRGKDQSIKLSNRFNLMGIAIFLAIVGAIMLSMFISWTSNTMSVILGVQGRYFIPVLPFVCFVLNSSPITVEKDISKFIMMMCILLQSSCIYEILKYTIS